MLPCYFRNTTRGAPNWAYRSQEFRRQVHTRDTHTSHRSTFMHSCHPQLTHMFIYPWAPARKQHAAACLPLVYSHTLVHAIFITRTQAYSCTRVFLHGGASYTSLTFWPCTRCLLHTRAAVCAHTLPRSACSLPGPPTFTRQDFLSIYHIPGPMLHAGDRGGENSYRSCPGRGDIRQTQMML